MSSYERGRITAIALKGYGNYITAESIGKKIVELVQSDYRFVMPSDGRFRPGSVINDKILYCKKSNSYSVYKGASGRDIIRINAKTDSCILAKMEEAGLIRQSMYRRHGKLDLYSEWLAEILIRDFAETGAYKLQPDMYVSEAVSGIYVQPLDYFTLQPLTAPEKSVPVEDESIPVEAEPPVKEDTTDEITVSETTKDKPVGILNSMRRLLVDKLFKRCK